MKDDPNLILEIDPTHILIPGTDPPSDPELEWSDHLRERASILRQNNSCPQMNNAYSRIRCCCGGAFPGRADIGQEIRSRRGRFREGSITAITIHADCG